jgi:uncharacterized membrane protein
VDPHQGIEQLNDVTGLDSLVAVIDDRVPASLRSGTLREALSGAPIGHALHPMLTDLPIGARTSATLLDLRGRGRWRGASATLTAIGLVAAAPTVASGLVEWEETPHDQRRVTAVHAAANSVASGWYLLSVVAKLAGRDRSGRRAAVAGALALGVGGYLGGHLSLGRGVGVGNRAGGGSPSTGLPAAPQ